MATKISETVCSQLQLGSAKQPSGKSSSHNRLLLAVVVAVLCTVLPGDIAELIFALLGAFIFAMVQNLRRENKKKPQPILTKSAGSPVQRQPPAPHKAAVQKSIKPSTEQPPILAPTFSSTHWDGEVAELLKQITPTKENEAIVTKLAQSVQRHLCSMLPEAEVAGYVSGNFTSGKAFGVAVPEVDIVASVSPAALISRLQSQSGRAASEVREENKVQKWAIRTFTDRLVASGDFKFRRSAFKLDEPKVILLAATSLGICAESIPFEFSVNAVTPLYNTALLTECGQIEPRAKELILLVKRWAKDRGICHATKGHLSPYLWGILTIYFLQVEGRLLPPLQQFQSSSRLVRKGKTVEPTKQSQWQSSTSSEDEQSTAALFKGFIKFYTSKFDWRNEAISMRLGQRAPPDVHLPIHIIQDHSDGATMVGPSIEDPFEVTRNLGACTNVESMNRLKEELNRADKLCDCSASLTELLEPWAPAEIEAHNLNNSGITAKSEKSPQAPVSGGSSKPPWRK